MQIPILKSLLLFVFLAGASRLLAFTVHTIGREAVIAHETVEPRGSDDASTRIQHAVDVVSKAGGGTVFLPSGRYVIAAPVTVRVGVTLRGEPRDGRPMSGTVLAVTAGKGVEDGPAAFSLEHGSGLVGLTFWYPEQSLARPVSFPWTIRTSKKKAGNNQTVSDCFLLNAWQGIDIGPESNELHTFRNVSICALRTGVCVDGVTDIGRVSEVLISPSVWKDCPGAPRPEDVRAYLLTNETVGAEYGRSDWEYIWRLAVNGYRTGVVFRQGARGRSNAVMADCHITGCGTALEIRALNKVGLAAYRCTFEGTSAPFRFADTTDNAVMQFHSCALKGSAAILGGSRTVTLFQKSKLSGAVLHTGQLVLTDTEGGAVRLGPAASGAVIAGCDPSRTTVDNQMTNGVYDVSSEPYPSAGGEVVPEPMVHPVPASSAVFFVTDFGASPNCSDNAAAFGRAFEAARKNGGTVYVPAGQYPFRSEIIVPSGVELRGVSDVPHHTQSGGSVLMILTGRGQEDGTPFVRLEPGSGLRGLGFWYPEQNLPPVPYPWTVRSLGPKCWLTDVNIGNAWQGVDFAAFPSDGHRIRYLSGAMYRRGLFVGNCHGKGWVEDLQFNPHYGARVPHGYTPNADMIPYQREHLEGMIFRDCENEQLRGNFLYAAFDGIAFHGKVNAAVLMHGTDTGSRALVLDTVKGSDVSLALSQLVSLGDFKQAALVSEPANAGTACFRASQIWAPGDTARLSGSGLIHLEGFNTCSPAVFVTGGNVRFSAGHFALKLPEPIVSDATSDVVARAVISSQGPLRINQSSRARSKR